MKLEIVGRHLELSDSIKHRINEMAETFCHHDAAIEQIRVEVELEKHSATHTGEYAAKGRIDHGREHLLAHAKGDELPSVLNDLESKLDRLLRRKSKRKVTERRHLKAIDLDVTLPKLDAL